MAREAGVSRATVSYVLNNKVNQSVSEATRALVLQTAQRLGHVPHASARALRLGRSNVVLVLVSDFTFGYVRDQVLEALDAAMTNMGYVLLVHRYSGELRPLVDLWPLVSPDVVVSMGGLSVSDTRSIRDAQTKLVDIRRLFDQSRAGAMQAEYLYGRGHRRLGYAYPTDANVGLLARERLSGTRAACARLGIRPPAVRQIDRGDVRTIRAALDSWRRLRGPVTAICAHNDEIAVMLSLALSSRAMRAAGDFAVIGIDDIPAASLGITTIAVDIDLVTKRIIEDVVATLEGRPSNLNRKPALRLVRRESA